MTYTATYSPEDNKLRLYSSTRLDRKLYARVRGAGFIYAPKQELFVAPMWTPEREDLLIELCGEIDDEDTSLVERAEERADRFVDYKDKRVSDAERAHEAVSRIADNIPLGQPILIGHHSERHARKDAERIENGMRKTVKMWHTAKYWEDRAKGALRHAKYKELPGVRHRRIKSLEADLRRYQNSFTPDPKTKPQMWDGEEHVWITNGSRGGRWAKSSGLPAIEQQSRRWIEHLQNRIAYEKAMLREAGGIAAAQFSIEVGGRVLVADEWVVVLKPNRVGGTLNSVSTTPLRHWHGSSTKVEIERVKDYRAPGPGDTEKVKAATKLPPLCNYPGEGFAQMTQAEWDKKHKDYKTTRAVDATATHARHRVRHAMTTGYKYGHIFITDAKRVDPPAAPLAPAGPEVFAREKDSRQGTDLSPSTEMSRAIHAAIPKDDRIPSYEHLHEMGKAATAGVQVVIAPQLFPTPPELADRMVDFQRRSLGDIRAELRIELLRIEEALRLDGAWLTILALSNVEDDRVGMELRRHITVHRASRVVLELGGHEFACCLGRMVPANARLRELFQLFERDADTVTVRLTYAVIAAYQSRQRHRFRSGESCVPPGAMLHRLDGLAVRILVFVRRSLANQLFACLRVLALTEVGKILSRNRTGKPQVCCETALPLAGNDAALRPIILLPRCELLLVVALCLAGGQRL
jgi:hypothetical protein